MEDSYVNDEKASRIFLWTNPRSLSTVFLKCFSFMEGACIWNLPYVSTHYNELMSDSEIVKIYPKLSRLKTQIDEISEKYDFFGEGNLRPTSTFSYEWVQEELSKPLPAGKKFLFVKEGAKSIIGRFDKLPKLPEYIKQIFFKIENGKNTNISDLMSGAYESVKETSGPKNVLYTTCFYNKAYSDKDIGTMELYVMHCSGLEPMVSGFIIQLHGVPFKHTFLIRDPLRSANSVRRIFMEFFQFHGDPGDFDVYESNPLLDTKVLPPNPCHDVWKYVKENIDPDPVVIDADDLQNFPEQILKKYCEAVDIPFHAKYLQWEESDQFVRNFNGCLELMVLGTKRPHHEAAFTSTCFKPIKTAKPKIEDLTPDAQRYVLENRDGYNEMYESRLKPEL